MSQTNLVLKPPVNRYVLMVVVGTFAIYLGSIMGVENADIIQMLIVISLFVFGICMSLVGLFVFVNLTFSRSPRLELVADRIKVTTKNKIVELPLSSIKSIVYNLQPLSVWPTLVFNDSLDILLDKKDHYMFLLPKSVGVSVESLDYNKMLVLREDMLGIKQIDKLVEYIVSKCSSVEVVDKRIKKTAATK